MEEQRSDFLCLDVAKDVVAEFTRSAKELLFRAGHRKTYFEFHFNQMQGADEVCELEKTVTTRRDIHGELNRAAEVSLKDLMQKPCDGGLPTVIVNLDAAECGEARVVPCNKVGERCLEVRDNLVGSVDELLVNGEAMIPILNFSGEGHHARENASTELAAEHRVVLLAADEGPGMETVSFKPYFAVGLFKACNISGNVNRLIVEKHADDVEPTFSVREAEVPGFVNEDAKRFPVHAAFSKKREWRDANLATHAESFPRIPVTPAKAQRSIGSVSYSERRRKSVREEFRISLAKVEKEAA